MLSFDTSPLSAKSSLSARSGVGLAGIAVVVPMAVVTAPLATASTQVGMYGATTATCAALPERSAVIIAEPQLRLTWQAALRGFCDVPVAALKLPDDTASLKEAERAWAALGYDLFVVSDRPLAETDLIEWDFRFSYPERTVLRAPTKIQWERFRAGIASVEDSP